MKIVPVVLCGGAGSRLWPVSRESHPKPFIRLEDNESLLQKAWVRGASLPGAAEVLTVTNRELLFKTQDEYAEVSKQASNKVSNSYILEPFGRNTAPAIAAAALQVAERHGADTIMVVLAADHLIANPDAFSDAVAEASRIALTGKLVTFGIRPESPETGYGYIEHEGNNVVRFVEKPNLATATGYVSSGRHLWNSGMFCFTAGTLISEMQLHCNDILVATETCLQNSRIADGKNFVQIDLNAELFEDVPDDSIDYALIEKSANVAVIPCDIGWSDIGSWRALGDLVNPDEQGNRIEGHALLHDVSHCHIQSRDRMVGAVGISNLIIIDTPDAVLVADRNRSQDVKHLYASLKGQGHELHKLHRTVHRPWGTYTVLEEGKNFKIKRIEVKPGASLSLQMHHHRSEHWIVVSGTAKVTNGDRELMVRANESTYIPAGHKHRLENPGVVDIVMIEVQSGEYLGEDDIVRFQDNYGRT